MIKDLIEQAFEKKVMLKAGSPPSRQPLMTPETSSRIEVPTLQPGVYQKPSPMIAERFHLFGRWRNATHGHWLSIGDLESLWGEPDDQFLVEIQSSRAGGERGWPDEASALFRPERLSLFACSELNYEKIYLLWLEFWDEPELWVYDANGETRYKDISTYLQAYINDDMSSAGVSWRVQ